MTGDTPDVQAFWDVLIPGTEGWPSASVALAERPSLIVLLEKADQAWVERQTKTFATMPDVSRVQAVELLERTQPELFQRVLAALYEAYYSSTLVQVAVRRLADAGPREPSSRFDESLLLRVVASKAGKRRL